MQTMSLTDPHAHRSGHPRLTSLCARPSCCDYHAKHGRTIGICWDFWDCDDDRQDALNDEPTLATTGLLHGDNPQ